MTVPLSTAFCVGLFCFPSICATNECAGLAEVTSYRASMSTIVPLSNGSKLRTAPANVPGTSPPVTPAIAGKLVIHFVKVTSTLAPPLACVCAPATPPTPDGEVGEKVWLLHAAVKMHRPINAGLMVPLHSTGTGIGPVRYE